MNLPGYDFAKEWNYSLQSYSGDKSSATYVRDFEECVIFLTIDSRGVAKIERIIGLIRCSIEFRIPHPNFGRFQNQLISLKEN